MNYYLIRLGEGSKYIDEARKESFIAIGWNQIPDLTSKLKSKNYELRKEDKILEDIKKELKAEGASVASVAGQAGQIYRFGFEMQEGDRVLAPLGEGRYLVGEVGAYYYEEHPKGACPYKHRRSVRWLDRVLLKEDMSTTLGYGLGALMTIFSIQKHAHELEALLAGERYTPAEKPQRIRDLVLSGLLELDGKEFEEFVRHLLAVIGYRAETTQYSRDKGVDVMGSLNAEGLAEIRLQIQVKRYEKGSIGARVVRELKGSLSIEEHGCIITTSTFSNEAYEEAEKPGHKAIKLIDRDDLAGLILKHFDDIDDDYKKRLGIRRKKDFNIEDQFEAHEHGEEAPPPVEEKRGKALKPDWDTMVCAAQEEGFQRAFIQEKAWWAVRINQKYLDHIKYIAIYRVAPISAITHYGKVAKIEPYENTGKYKLYLKGDPLELKPPVGLGNNIYLKPQGPRYALLGKILQAKQLDDIFGLHD